MNKHNTLTIKQKAYWKGRLTLINKKILNTRQELENLLIKARNSGFVIHNDDIIYHFTGAFIKKK